MEKELKEISKKLDALNNRREYPNSLKDIDDICDKLDIIIELLNKKVER